MLLRKPADPASAPVRLFFDEGLYPAELGPAGLLRWAGPRVTFRLHAPSARRHRLDLRLITPFWQGTQQVEVAHGNGRPAGTLEFSGSNFAQAQVCSLDMDLAAGPNAVTLTARREAQSLSSTDPRLVAFGILTDVET